MIRTTLQSVLCFCLSPLLVAQELPGKARDAVDTHGAALNEQSKAATVALARKTIVRLVQLESVSSATAQKGQTVKLALADDVIVKGTVVIRKGTPASGVVTDVRKAIPGKRSGNLSIEVVSLTLPDNSQLPLREHVDDGGDGVSNVEAVFLLVMTPIYLPLAIVEWATESRSHDHTPKATDDQVSPACSPVWASTKTKVHIRIGALTQTQNSNPTIDVGSICPAPERLSPSFEPLAPPGSIETRIQPEHPLL